ncbi:MAG: ATP-dependent DNA helicase, partial [Gammaproteobacteria bacterium]|nr:ATP-dependent DNA helicase [Gammaproteobacteria bacterium]
VFPDQIACAENLRGRREVPDHPLVTQTIDDCLHDAMDIDGLERLLRRIRRGEIHVACRDLTEPSPLAQEILNARPYAFLDDAPLEERRTRAVASRRWLDPEAAADLGRLDSDAIRRVRDEAWPRPASADELHDMLAILGYAREEEFADAGGRRWRSWIATLMEEGRATCLSTAGGRRLWVSAERLPELTALHADAVVEPALRVPAEYANRGWDRQSALREILRSRLDAVGPVTSSDLAGSADTDVASVEATLAALESEGFVIRGRFTGDEREEWCERRLLARIHRYTLDRLRREIEPVSPAHFMRFLFDWQHLSESSRMQGPGALAEALKILEGFEAPAAAWEADILPGRIADYDSSWLDQSCTSGRVAWLRLSRGPGGNGNPRSASPVRSTPIALLARSALGTWIGFHEAAAPGLSPGAVRVLACLDSLGASFFDDLAAASGLLPSQLEDALAELCAAGLISADSFAGLRGMLNPGRGRRTRRRAPAAGAMAGAGRWWRVPGRSEVTPESKAADADDAEYLARVLLARYGVVMKRLLDRETFRLPWRDLLRAYRRLEARGEIRGGRFVDGVPGEQFALPEAVSALRAVRRRPADGEQIVISAADPTNLLGTLLPGGRVPSISSNRILFRDGLPLAVYAGREVRFLDDADGVSEWDVRNRLLRRRVPAGLRAGVQRIQ